MAHSTVRFAAAHNHLSFYPAMDLVSAGNWLRRFPQRHAVLFDVIEWAFAATVALVLLCGTLIAN